MKKQDKKDYPLVWVVSSTESPLNYLDSSYSADWHNVQFVSVQSWAK
jgi:hypothetical protein